MRDELMRLAEACEGAGVDNRLDVAVEVALFKPNRVYSAVRTNSAGTKLIYTDAAGNQVTCWAEDWTASHRRQGTIAALRARATQSPDGEGGVK